MSCRRDFECRLNEALDRMVDPLDDPEVRAWLQEHPEDIEGIVSLCADLQDLGSGSASCGRQRAVPRANGAVCAAACLFLAVAAGLLWMGRAEQQAPLSGGQDSVVSSGALPRFELISFRVEVETVATAGRSSVVLEGDDTSTRCYRTDQIGGPSPTGVDPAALPFHIEVVSQKELLR